MEHRSVLAITAIAVVATVAAAAVLRPHPQPKVTAPETVQIAAGLQSYRPAGEFRQGTRLVDAPKQPQTVGVLEIMKYQVSAADYARCMAENACPRTASGGKEGRGQVGGAAQTQAQENRAQTMVNHADAAAYAAWLSARTGQHWRLPTDAEWLRAAAERGPDDSFNDATNGLDPSRRWIASYQREVALRGDADLVAHPLGYFGENSLGVADIAGNVWEWTETCFQNGTLSPDGSRIATQTDYCGVRAVQGKHRAFVIEFIRDARSGGCAAGVPPDFLGFRLVRDRVGALS